MIEGYDGYRAYDWLEAGIDYREFDLVDDLYVGEHYDVELDDAEEARVERLTEDELTIAFHEHPFLHPKDAEEVFDYVYEGRVFTSWEGLARTSLDAVFDGLNHGIEMNVSKTGWKWDDVVYDVGHRQADVHKCPHAIHGTDVADIHRAREEGKIAWFAALEAATPIENELDRLDVLYGLGVRMIGITYNEQNTLGTGSNEADDSGLTTFGKAAVERMNKLGMAIGMSHESEGTILDVCETSRDPVALSHTGARSVWDSSRVQPDDVLEAVAETGGIVAVDAAPNATRSRTYPDRHSIETVMEHFDYIVDLVGIDHVTFATDTLYGDQIELMKAFMRRISMEVFASGDRAGGGLEQVTEMLDEIGYVEGMENPTESWINVPRWLVKHGYTDEEIRKVLSGNALRFLEAVL